MVPVMTSDILKAYGDGMRRIQEFNLDPTSPPDDGYEQTRSDQILQIFFAASFVVVFCIMICLSIFGRRVEPYRQPHPLAGAKMNEKDRRELVSKALVVKHVIPKPHQEEKEDDIEPAKERCNQHRRMKSNLMLSDLDDLDATRDSTREDWMCAICLNPYELGEEICWSQNSECRHVFHHTCIEEWLLKHDECPCCRNNYLANEDDEESKIADSFAEPLPRTQDHQRHAEERRHSSSQPQLVAEPAISMGNE